MKKNTKKKISIVKDGAMPTSSNKNKAYSITPKGILFAALCDAFDIGKDSKTFNKDIKKVDKFINVLLKGLSMLSSDGENDSLYGSDFTEFYKLCVKAFNDAGRYRKLLEQNGINPDAKDEDEEEEE